MQSFSLTTLQFSSIPLTPRSSLLLVLQSISTPASSFKQPLTCFLCLQLCLFSIFHINGFRICSLWLWLYFLHCHRGGSVEVEELALGFAAGKDSCLGRVAPKLCPYCRAPVGLEVRIQIHLQFRKKPVISKLPQVTFFV